MKLNIRLLAISSICISIAGAAIMTDWQSIGGDPCTEYSLFYYPELLQNPNNITLQASNECISVNYNDSDIRSQMQDKFPSYARKELPNAISKSHRSLRINCSGADEIDCLQCTTSAKNHGCVSYRVNNDEVCFELSMEAETTVALANESSTVCTISSLPFSACLNVRNSNKFAESDRAKIKTVVVALTEEMLELQSSSDAVVESDTWPTAKEACLQSEDNCYWNPLSRITKSRCHACPPICRGVTRSLNFVQFCIGVVVFVLAIPMARLALMVLISDYVETEDQVTACHLHGPKSIKFYLHYLQGPFTGFVVAAGGFARAVSPLWRKAIPMVLCLSH